MAPQEKWDNYARKIINHLFFLKQLISFLLSFGSLTEATRPLLPGVGKAGERERERDRRKE